MLTAERLRELLDFDPKTGIFTWKPRPPVTPHARTWNTKWAGKPAGSPKQGYVKIKIAGVFHNAHRLAWLHFYGEPANGELDHKDRDKANNSIANLRLATRTQNLVNRPIRKSNSSGIRGVTWRRDVGKWQAAICVRGKSLHLGCYADKHEAGRAYAAAAAHHYGEFAP